MKYILLLIATLLISSCKAEEIPEKVVLELSERHSINDIRRTEYVTYCEYFISYGKGFAGRTYLGKVKKCENFIIKRIER